MQKIEVSLPAVFTCDLRLNTPRFANVKSILKAKKKRVDTYKVEDLGIDIEPRVVVEEVFEPEVRQGGVILESVDELIDKLKNEAKVIWKFMEYSEKKYLKIEEDFLKNLYTCFWAYYTNFEKNQEKI